MKKLVINLYRRQCVYRKWRHNSSVKIIAGCVVGAGSVVTKNLEIKGAGNPAKLIKEI